MGAASSPPAHWLFLRGLARENAHWDDFPQRFAAALPDVRVHLLDLPGNGEYWRLDSPTQLAATLEFVRARARERMADEGDPGTRFHLLSMSLGSMLAIAWAHRYPQEIARAVLVNTSLAGFCPFYRRLSWQVWPLLLRIAASSDPARRERLILDLTTRQIEPTDAFLASRSAIYRRHPVRGVNVLRQLLAAARFRPPPQPPAVPLLLLNSLGDRMVAPECSKALACRWGMELRTHPRAGHDLPLDDPDWTIARVSDWARETRAVARG